jgi:predicted restriction endonuclease
LRRGDPCNGIALNALYDRAFGRGLITFNESLHVVVSRRLKSKDAPILQRQALMELEGQLLRLPHRFTPDAAALDFHRRSIIIPG